MNHGNQRIARRACIAVAALAVLAAGLELTREPPRFRVGLAQNRAGAAAAPSSAQETEPERDECTASAGFLGPAESADSQGSPRRTVCKRYA
ncbi:MAG TPA: hypothetical protein VHS09_11655 [Polyangiaceae bacterium]|nr:hypothetical protein [Polyangiaceae bacterium]